MAGDDLERLRVNARQRAKLLRERDQLIIEAKAAKIPVAHIAAAVGLSAMQVHRIIRDAK